MAIVNLTLAKLDLNTPFALPEPVALDAADGAYLPFRGQDTKTLLLLSGSGTAVIKAGDGPQAGPDLEVEVSAGGTALELESGGFKLTGGEHKGTVHITGPATVKAQAMLLL